MSSHSPQPPAHAAVTVGTPDGRFDHLKCGVCGVPWDEHLPECRRHEFRPGVQAESVAPPEPTAPAAPPATGRLIEPGPNGEPARNGVHDPAPQPPRINPLAYVDALELRYTPTRDTVLIFRDERFPGSAVEQLEARIGAVVGEAVRRAMKGGE